MIKKLLMLYSFMTVSAIFPSEKDTKLQTYWDNLNAVAISGHMISITNNTSVFDVQKALATAIGKRPAEVPLSLGVKAYFCGCFPATMYIGLTRFGLMKDRMKAYSSTHIVERRCCVYSDFDPSMDHQWPFMGKAEAQCTEGCCGRCCFTEAGSYLSDSQPKQQRMCGDSDSD